MILTCLLIFLAVAHPQANSWRGIVPLHSTRADVEKILGPPRPESKGIDASTYNTETEKVFILYSTGPCDVKPSNGWNAPRGTVLEVSVEPKVKPKLSDLEIDISEYNKNRDPELLDYTYYTDDKTGISITVNTAESVVTSISYWPTSKQNYLRCSTRAENLQVFKFLPYKFAEYSNIAIGRERKRLGGFARLLRRYPSTQGHIIAYAGKHADAGEAQRLAERAKDYLVRSHGVVAERIMIETGGYRDRWTIELYLIPPGVAPPPANPTVNPSQVQILKADSARTKKRRSYRWRCSYDGGD